MEILLEKQLERKNPSTGHDPQEGIAKSMTVEFLENLILVG